MDVFFHKAVKDEQLEPFVTKRKKLELILSGPKGDSKVYPRFFRGHTYHMDKLVNKYVRMLVIGYQSNSEFGAISTDNKIFLPSKSQIATIELEGHLLNDFYEHLNHCHGRESYCRAAEYRDIRSEYFGRTASFEKGIFPSGKGWFEFSKPSHYPVDEEYPIAVMAGQADLKKFNHTDRMKVINVLMSSDYVISGAAMRDKGELFAFEKLGLIAEDTMENWLRHSENRTLKSKLGTTHYLFKNPETMFAELYLPKKL